MQRQIEKIWIEIYESEKNVLSQKGGGGSVLET